MKVGFPSGGDVGGPKIKQNGERKPQRHEKRRDDPDKVSAVLVSCGFTSRPPLPSPLLQWRRGRRKSMAQAGQQSRSVGGGGAESACPERELRRNIYRLEPIENRV